MSQDTSAASFAVSILKTAPPSSSLLFSPSSLSSALAIVHDGAEGETKRELAELLLSGHDSSAVSSYHSSLPAVLTGSRGVCLSVAARCYVDIGVALKEDFELHVKEQYDVDVVQLEFGDATYAAMSVNNYVAKKTNHNIEKLVEEDVFEEAAIVLVNAVHFSAGWQRCFDDTLTFEQIFHGAGGEREESFMHSRNVPARYFSNDSVHALALSYEDTAFSLMILLPADYEEFRSSLTGAALLDYAKQLRTRNININMPKFTAEHTLDGEKTLSALGVSGLFKGGLNGIADDPRLIISAIVHKAVIEVNEEGTEASAATAVIASFKSLIVDENPIPTFTADRPFIYAVIKDNSHLLFIGQYC